MNFSGRTILISGGTRGIGRACAEILADLGASVLVTGTGDARAPEVRGKGTIEVLHLDFSRPASVDALCSILEQRGRIDGLVNNAGINRINHVWDGLEEDWDALMQVNLKGIFLLTRWVANHMRNHRAGRIVNIASVFGVVSREKRFIYSTTKAGLIGFTRGIALDLAPYAVLVNALSPGFVLTDLTRNILKPEEMARLAERIPLGRLAEPHELARPVAFLLSEENTYLTGQNIVVDGGFTCA